MVTILVRFPAGRYHATPWGHHVNEGLIEWPPSPWRVLRALLATGYEKLGWSPEAPPDDSRSLIEKLSSTLPRYGVPEANGAHSRHFMPLGSLDKGRERTGLVFDTWANVEGELAIVWDLSLAAAELEALRRLTNAIGYLGRSESWVEAEVHDLPHTFDAGSEVVPCDDSSPHRPGWEQVPLLTPMVPSEYETWRLQAVATLLRDAEIDPNKKRLSKREQKRIAEIEGSYPVDLLACLQVETRWLRTLGWSQPPGSRRRLYWRRADGLEGGAPKPRMVRRAPPSIEAVLLSMATASGNEHALPPVTRTLPQAELLHRALVARVSGQAHHSIVLTGRESDGRPLDQSHRHAHILPLDLDLDGHLDHVLIWAPMGLDRDAQAAIRAVRHTFTKGGAYPLRVAVAGLGNVGDLARIKPPYGSSLASLVGAEGSGLVWRSVTPFVAPRFLKPRGRNSLEGQVQAELKSRGYPAATEIEVRDPRLDPSALRHRHFVRVRRHGPPPPADRAWSLELRFSQPVTGPMILGYGSHYGLGVFGACH